MNKHFAFWRQKLTAAFFATGKQAARDRGAELLRELRKPAARINEQRCLKVIEHGVDLRYEHWFTRKDRTVADAMFDGMMTVLHGEQGVLPSKSEAFLLACEKAPLSVVQALVEKKIFHPDQWDRATAETGRIAAAKADRLDVFVYLDEKVKALAEKALPASYHFAVMGVKALTPSQKSKAYRPRAKDFSRDYTPRTLYLNIRDLGAEKIVLHMLEQSYERSKVTENYSVTLDAAARRYDDYQATVARELGIVRAIQSPKNQRRFLPNKEA